MYLVDQITCRIIFVDYPSLIFKTGENIHTEDESAWEEGNTTDRRRKRRPNATVACGILLLREVIV